MTELLSVTEAETRVLSHAGDFGTENLPLARATGRILRQDVYAERDQPPYDRVMMDGIALRAGSAEILTCAGLQRAGQRPQALPEGDVCLEVTTGAVLPVGADCVIPVEDITLEDKMVRLSPASARKGQFIHARGADCAAGARLIAAGAVLDGPSLGVLAANGYAAIDVAAAPSVGIVTTGDELVDPGAPVRDWEIRRSNDAALAGLLQGAGVTRIETSSVPDDLHVTIRHLAAQLARHPLLVLSGGVSAGAFDYVPRALAQLGVEKIFHKVAQRPGGPLWFGIGREGQRVFGLPGNPVSALICAARYIVPLLRAGMGAAPIMRHVRLAQEAGLFAGRTRFLPVLLGEEGQAVPRPAPTSGDFCRLAGTDGFVELPPGEGNAPAGTKARFHGW